jgi:protein TonB
MMRLWLDSYARRTFVASSATISIAAHAVLIASWVYATLPPPGMPIDGLANRTYPQYVPPPNQHPGIPGSHESVRYIEMPQVGLGTGDGGHKVGDDRPVVTDPTIGAAPVDSVPTPEAPAVNGSADSVFTLIDVDSAVTRSVNSAAPQYPSALLAQHVMGYVSARYVVDTTGLADSASFEVIESTNPEFVDAVRAALPGMRFTPAKIGRLKVRQLVEQTFSFKIDDSALGSTAPAAPAGSSSTKAKKPPNAPPR